MRLLYRVEPDAFVFMMLDPESDDVTVPAAWRIRRTVGEAPTLLGEESVARLGTIEANSRKPGKVGRSGVSRGLIAEPLDGELVSTAEVEAWLGTRTELGERPVAS